VRCPILIGREEPAAWLAGSVRRLSGPRRGSALVLAGEAGIGKSRLAQHLSAVAGRAGIRVVTGRALPGGIGGILAPVAEVVLEVTRDRSAPAAADPELAPYRAVLASVVPHWREPGWSAPAEPIVVTAEAVLRVLRWATEGAGVVVILEDLHWADDATLAVARYLADHADEVPIALLATVRTGDGRDDVIALLGAAGAEVSRLGRLTSDEAAAMVAACTGRDAPATGQLAALVHAAEGLPLLVEDLLATGDLGGLPPRFADTVRARLARLDTGQRSVLDAAALLGRRFDGRLLAAATDLPGEAVAGALYRGAAAQLIVPEGDGFAFRHALTRDVILADLTAADRRRLSLAAAGALAGATDAFAGGTGAPAGDDDGRALLIGRLLADGGQRARAAQTLLAAGRGALAAGDFAAAELLLREADQIAGSPDDRQVSEDLQIAVAGQFAQVLLDGGQAGEAARIAARAVRIADGRDLAAAISMRGGTRRGPS
jgi:predicted ATPase